MMAMNPPDFSKFTHWYGHHQEQIFRDFFTFLSFPTIGTDPVYSREMRQTAEWLVVYLRKIGLEVALWETSGHPIVFASYLHAGPNRPTVLIYHHYDVQPVDPLPLWHSDPFKPVLKDNHIYARGASDNKGQCFYSIQAIAAFLQLTQEISVNIKLFIEGEEESGGAGTFRHIPQKKEELKADYLLVVDGDIPGPDIPAISLGVRGITTMQAECINSSTDLHSGIHGGMAFNPNRALTLLLSKLWDDSGKVAIPGFYDQVRPLSKEEISHLNLDFDENAYKKAFGIKALAGEKGYSLLESNWMRPTLEINGLSGGYTGTGFKTVIPAKAIAKISCRLVPDQDPSSMSQLVSDFLRASLTQGMELFIELYAGAAAYRTPFPSLLADSAAKVYTEVFGRPCHYLLHGGSVPIVAELAKVSGAEAIIIGTALAQDNIHAPNEHFGLDRFKRGFLVIGGILGTLSTQGKHADVCS
jgi:acetylornithine deacetylase/succinyl-diaminopimelate desuccinylase-like protein